MLREGWYRAGIGLKLDRVQGFEGFGEFGSIGFRVSKDLGLGCVGFRCSKVLGLGGACTEHGDAGSTGMAVRQSFPILGPYITPVSLIPL